LDWKSPAGWLLGGAAIACFTGSLYTFAVLFRLLLRRVRVFSTDT
jgi:hypothetical protein